ncbi:flap endonuclease GEN homolog 1-like isoform X2 [Mizuhopecten yessoensis]|uniref:flap endonuclease GEN homolog 1-like isoform X2 n=1 Tax=Mizuhopecten yessoensis TaxID=6573 RepID=UPI000B4590E2|nr:flap endonuclease GEN homolog 1-like isoform X2 [Mizuhopecten yessoensis]
MGVKTLWPILEDAIDTEDKSIRAQSLRGKLVAVDLSSWVVEFQQVSSIKNLYIRNLYCRTTELLGYGIKLIFVADGIASKMKAAEIKKRKEAQGGEARSSMDYSRAKFLFILKKCEELLKILGVPFLYSDGEGEALCAALNAEGKVDGVMTSDVDAFLYGATTVYRNYRTESGVHYVDVYKMDKIQSELGLDRRAMVVCALLVGCDWHRKGLEGVGIKKALELIDSIKKLGQDPLDRLCGWKNNKEIKELDKVVKSKHCSNCDHEGGKSSHKSEGCGYCGTSVSCLSYKPNPTAESDTTTPPTKPCRCSWHQRKNHELELRLWNKAMTDETFPNQEIIEEFLGTRQDSKSFDPTFRPIDVCGAKIFMTEYFPSMNSKAGKIYSNMANVLVQLQLHNMKDSLKPSTTLKPLRIMKTHKKMAGDQLEVRWSKLGKSSFDQYTLPLHA